MELEDKNIEYKIIKQKFLNYRQFNFKLIKGKNRSHPCLCTLIFNSAKRQSTRSHRIQR